MKYIKLVVLLAVAIGVLGLSAACIRSSDRGSMGEELGKGKQDSIASTAGFQDRSYEAKAKAKNQLVSSLAPSNLVGPPKGILVTGTGTVVGNPDVAMAQIGVEVTSSTVKDALDQANTALRAILDVLDAHSIDSKDTETSLFTIQPQYDYRRDGERVPIGYMVINQVNLKVRDMDSVGRVIDEVVAAGRDNVVIHGISFTVEDPSAMVIEAREIAVREAVAQARHLAHLTGVEVGPLIHISETSYTSPTSRFAGEVAMFEMAMAPTPLRPGETEVSVSVNVFFSIK